MTLHDDMLWHGPEGQRRMRFLRQCQQSCSPFDTIERCCSLPRSPNQHGLHYWELHCYYSLCPHFENPCSDDSPCWMRRGILSRRGLLQRNEPCCIGFSPENSQDGPAEDANSFHYVDLRLFDTWFPHPVRICSKYGCPSQNVLSPEATSVGSQAVNCPKLQTEVPEIRLLSGWCATHLGSTNNPSGCPANWTTAYERQPKSSLSSWWNENNGRRHLLHILYS